MINEKNIKLFPIYKLFSYDLLFYYATSMLYLNQVKLISVSDILLLSSIYCAFQFTFQVPVTLVVDKLGYRRCMILGNILCTIGILFYIIGSSFGFIVFGDLNLALGFALKGVSESPFIFTVMKKEGLKDMVSKIEAKGSSLYFVVEAGASILSGYLFLLSPYLPISFCLLSMLTATILSFKFNDTYITRPEPASMADAISDMKNGFTFIFHSDRLKSILIYSCVLTGILSVASSFSKAYLTDLEVSSKMFGLIFAWLNIASAIGSAMQEKFESKRKNKTLSYIAVIFTSVFIFIGLAYIIGFNSSILIAIGIIVFTIQNFFKGGYRVLVKKYLSNFTTSAIRSKIMSIYYLVETFGTTVLLFLASRTISVIDIGTSYIVSGVLFLLMMLLILDYMRSRFGLKPEQYRDKDINYKCEHK